MICKGTTHNNGARLARYMTQGKARERAELWQLIGFAAGDIRDAFRSVHVMAEATRCEQPFFHVQVRNREGEDLSREQWVRAADRLEDKLGLRGQPRAISFHIDERTGDTHMHVAWSRIDDETMTARPLPFFQQRLKEVAREMERTFGLEPVRNERDGRVQAPTRDEFEQARRLGVDLNEIRKTIRDCWEQSDGGRSFRAALADRGLTLAAGDRRDYVVIDPEGGLHALGRRILGVTAAETRRRLSDIDRDELPSVSRAREFAWERAVPQRMPDPYRTELAWQDALIRAAIAKEKRARNFVESPRDNGAGKEAPLPPRPERECPEYTVGRSLNAGETKRTVAEGARVVGKAMDGVAGMLDALLAPKLSPEQKREGARATRRREIEAEEQIDISKYTSQQQLQQQQQHQRDVDRQRDRDSRDR